MVTVEGQSCEEFIANLPLTIGGIALAFANQQAHKPTVHAIGVCDDPDYFYQYIAGIADEMGFRVPSDFASTESFMREHVVVHQGKGLGYARSTAEELEFVQAFCCATGIVLDPVYSGKALYNFVKYANSANEDGEGAFR